MPAQRSVPILERLAVAVLAVLVEPSAFGLPATWHTPQALVYALVGVVVLGHFIDRRRLARALRAAADAVDEPDGSDQITIVE